MAEAAGAEILTGVKVTDISKGRVKTSDREFDCDLVVSAGGNSAPANPNAKYSCSGVAIFAALREPLPGNTVTHSVVMPDDPAALHRDLEARRDPKQTMAFVNYYKAGEIYDNQLATVAVLLAAPANGKSYNLESEFVRSELNRISQEIGLSKPIDDLFADYKIFDPAYFASWGSNGGALYGKVHPVWRSGPFHYPGYRSLTKPWMWRVGAGVHPGGGIPAVLGGAMNSVELLLRAN